ncbi:MAG: hypothetical protein KAU26_01370 [Methylococcales bacterium]|nr:hypothetical protein [Methylococcales bacterium]
MTHLNLKNNEQNAWEELKKLLSERITAAESGAVSDKTFKQITDEAVQKWNNSQPKTHNQ